VTWARRPATSDRPDPDPLLQATKDESSLRGERPQPLDQDSVISRVTQINQTGAISQARLPVDQFFAGYNVFDYFGAANPSVTPEALYGLAHGNYRGRQTSADPSALAARRPNFGAYQDFRVIRLGMTLTF
jgi:hypothetical protein